MAINEIALAHFHIIGRELRQGGLGVPSVAGGALLSSTTDLELARAWLGRPELSPRTVRNARKEAERFLAWCRYQGKTLRDVRYEDLAGYSAFLDDPQPEDLWISPTRWPRADARWRPFTGPLSDSSHRQAMIVLRSMFAWAVKARYLDANPAELLGRMRPPMGGAIERYLPIEGIGLLQRACKLLPGENGPQILVRARASFLVNLFYLTGARLAEIAAADMSSIRKDDGGRWWIHVIGKGSKERKMPIAGELVAEFKRYRKAFGLAPLPAAGENLALALTTRGKLTRATPGTLFNVVKGVMRAAADLAEEQEEGLLAERLRKASTHWLRHSCFTHMADADVKLKTIQITAGHSDIKTTAGYLHKDDETRHAEITSALKMPGR